MLWKRRVLVALPFLWRFEVAWGSSGKGQEETGTAAEKKSWSSSSSSSWHQHAAATSRTRPTKRRGTATTTRKSMSEDGHDRRAFEVSVQFGDDEPATFDFGGGDNDDDDAKNSTCFAQPSCEACREASSICHWCESENACHVMGSVYGCLVGASTCNGGDGQSQASCQRSQPEPYSSSASRSEVPMGWMIGLGMLMVACAGMSLWVVKTLVGTTTFHMRRRRGGGGGGGGGVGSKTRYSPAQGGAGGGGGAAAEVVEENDLGPAPANDADAAAGGVMARHFEGPPSSRVMQEPDHDVVEEQDGSQVPWWLSNIGKSHGAAASVPTPQFMPERPAPRAAPTTLPFSSRTCLVACRGCVVLTVLLTVTMVTLGILYYPRMPLYNVCSNQLDWQSIVDGMESLQLQADFQLLVSVANPNRFSIVADMVSGKLLHEGTYVASLSLHGGGSEEGSSSSSSSLSSATLEPRAITDFLVDVTFTPDKWEALSLTTEFYQGTLTLSLDAQATIRVPLLQDYTYQAKYQGYMLHVNDQTNRKDRHLCACPNW